MVNYKFLKDVLHNTNMDTPENNIGYDTFPDQRLNVIGKRIKVRYVDEHTVPSEYKEDSKDVREDISRTLEDYFTFIRADDTDKYPTAKTVLISDSCDRIIIQQKDKTVVDFVAPEAMKYLVGQKVTTVYDDRQTRDAYILYTQGLENGFTILVEYLDSATYRILFDTERSFNYDTLDETDIEPDTKAIRKRLLDGREPLI